MVLQARVELSDKGDVSGPAIQVLEEPPESTENGHGWRLA
jgi:hypothetical protein